MSEAAPSKFHRKHIAYIILGIFFVLLSLFLYNTEKVQSLIYTPKPGRIHTQLITFDGSFPKNSVYASLGDAIYIVNQSTTTLQGTLFEDSATSSTIFELSLPPGEEQYLELVQPGFAFVSNQEKTTGVVVFVGNNTKFDKDKDNSRFNLLTEVFDSFLTSQASSTKLAFSELRKAYKVDINVRSYCHTITHQVGHKAYYLYGMAGALTYVDDFCGSGYTHGVVEEAVKNNPRLLDNPKNICSGLAPDLFERCYHGLGHGIQKLFEDLKLSLPYCISRDKMFSGRCTEGVYMEYFTSYYTKGDTNLDPFKTCAEPGMLNSGVCYFYAPIGYLKENRLGHEYMLDRCSSIQDANSSANCIKGTMSRFVKDRPDETAKIDNLCGSFSDIQKRQACIKGALSYTLVHYGKKSAGKSLCDILKNSKQECLDLLGPISANGAME